MGKWRPSRSQNALVFYNNVTVEWPTGRPEVPNGIILNKSLKVTFCEQFALVSVNDL